MMDEKVLDVLIKRVEHSEEMYELHKNESWKKLLKRDRKQLEKYRSKITEESVPYKKPDIFTCVINGRKIMYSECNSGRGNFELIPQGNYDGNKLLFYKFDLEYNHNQSIEVKINGTKLYLNNECFSSSGLDDRIYSFVIVTPNVNYGWSGEYL